MKVAAVECETPIVQQVLYDLVIALRVGGIEAFAFASSLVLSEVFNLALHSLIQKEEGASR